MKLFLIGLNVFLVGINGFLAGIKTAEGENAILYVILTFLWGFIAIMNALSLHSEARARR